MTDHSELKKQDLLPCPFCGGKAQLSSVARDWHRISADHAETCLLEDQQFDCPQTDDQLALLLRDWNSRAPESEEVSPEVKAMLDRMEAEEQTLHLLAAAFVRKTSRASISALQRNFKLSYGNACRLMDGLVRQGVVSSIDSEGRRTVLPVSKEPSNG